MNPPHIRNHLADVSLALSVAPEEAPPLPAGLLEELYALPYPWNGESDRRCYRGLSPARALELGESTLLLPGEEQYLRQRLAVAGLPWLWRNVLERGVLLQIGEVCPYCQGSGPCPAFDHMPIVRRSWPLRGVKVGSDSVALYLQLECCDLSDFDDLRSHPAAHHWIGGWMAIVRHLDHAEWWDFWKKSLPARYQHLVDIITPRDLDMRGLPAHVLRSRAQPGCSTCGGNGFCGTSRCLDCFPDIRVAEILHEIQDAGNIFRPKNPNP